MRWITFLLVHRNVAVHIFQWGHAQWGQKVCLITLNVSNKQQQQQQRKLQLQVNYTQKKRCLVEFTQGYKCVEVNHDE